MAAPAALHAGRGHGRAGAAVDRGRGYTEPAVRSSTPGRLIDGHLKPTRDFHHLDGHDRIAGLREVPSVSWPPLHRPPAAGFSSPVILEEAKNCATACTRPERI